MTVCSIFAKFSFFATALVILITVAVVASAEAHDQLPGDDRTKPWHITADEITYDQKADQYIAKGNVTITKKDKKLTADFVRFDYRTMEVLAIGHVIMTVGEDILIGSSMEMDLGAEIGTVYNGTIFFKANNFYIKGDKIQKLGKNSYAADKVSITTCDGDRPAWKITGKNLRVTIEGYGFVNHAALWAKKVPVLYTPFLVFPAKLKRQSGLLPPQIGYSDRKWEEYIQPFYWAISESSDATFYAHHMGRRGDKFGLEYRYILDDKSKGALMYDFFNDRKVDDSVLNSNSDWGYEDDNELRPNSDRYWFRMKHDQSMPLGFFAKLDLDFVSDQDYLHEFRDGYTGFDKTEEYFSKNFSRELDDYDDPVRVNRLNLKRSWSKYSLNAEVRWYDNVINRRWKDRDTTLQKLPLIEFDGSRQQLPTTPFYFDLDSEYIYFFRKDLATAQTTGHRVDLHPRFYLPLRLGNYFSFEPSFGLRETAWYIDKYEDSSTKTDRTLSREIYDIKLDLSSEIFKVYHIKWEKIDGIKHIVTPQVVYDYIPDQDQDKYPSFDSIDRIEKQNLLTYSITNTLISKSRESKKKEKFHGDENDEPVSYTYHQFCRFKLEQSYDINKAKKHDPEPFSLVNGELELVPGRYFSIDADATWSQYESDFLSHNVAVTISDNREDRLFVEHRYTRDSVESIYTNLLLKISDRLSVYTDYERNLHDGKDIRTGAGFLYETQCWSIDCSYEDEDGDRRYAFMVNLYGLGEFGKSIVGRRIEKPFEKD